MTTRTTKTFEDRLLDELQREIALRAADVPEPVIRRTITTRRALVALAACVAAAGVVVALPSSTGGAPAFAVERNGDGSVRVSMGEIVLGGDDKRELAERLRAEGVHVSVDKPRSGFVCAQPRGEMYPLRWTDGSSGDVIVDYTYVLRPGDTLVFEDPEPVKGSVSPAGSSYAVKGKAKPCKEVPWDGSGARRDSFEEK
ncbi:hypothetical protein F9278_30565 [Streptomyces phaeolivaceus]|uniref:Uncharacterized protein n=1 Tax=Streptomyces phaeolivaceus TaxID=2653200 RepID=A0A5P8K9U1_9ACTN|nr:hypothetical protein [Streptomyces phaeolivaceus]QFQ99776.1 hypothetical protein F9278_30565 [Streptomyces phaeolivaceus]